MITQVQALIDQANKRSAASRRQLFAKRSSDLQMLEHQTKSARVVLDAFHVDRGKGMMVSNNLKAAMRELETFVCLAEKRLL